MKQKKIWLAMLALGIILTGCPQEPSDPTYTVWTDTVSHSEFSSAFGGLTLNNGMYIRYELTSSEWNSIKPSLTDEGKYNWTESEINKWFIGRGFGNSEANRETAWLMTISHGFIASRSGSLVYMLLK
ncbi:MAG: hypothetical protein FWF55_06335 [Treponema sp.]|nr:hypothetical protein [Treponema sp.]